MIFDLLLWKCDHPLILEVCFLLSSWCRPVILYHRLHFLTFSIWAPDNGWPEMSWLSEITWYQHTGLGGLCQYQTLLKWFVWQDTSDETVEQCKTLPSHYVTPASGLCYIIRGPLPCFPTLRFTAAVHHDPLAECQCLYITLVVEHFAFFFISSYRKLWKVKSRTWMGSWPLRSLFTIYKIMRKTWNLSSRAWTERVLVHCHSQIKTHLKCI